MNKITVNIIKILKYYYVDCIFKFKTAKRMSTFARYSDFTELKHNICRRSNNILIDFYSVFMIWPLEHYYNSNLHSNNF